MAPAPWFEVSPDSVKQFRFRMGLLGHGGPPEEAGAELGVPVDVVAAAHLVFEESRKEQTLCSRGLQHQRVRQDAHIGDEMVEHRGQVGGSRHCGVWVY